MTPPSRVVPTIHLVVISTTGILHIQTMWKYFKRLFTADLTLLLFHPLKPCHVISPEVRLHK